MKNINSFSKIVTLVFTALLFCYVSGIAQEETTTEPVKERPARPAFESGLLFDGSTTNLQPSKTLEMVIQHRFGTMDNGATDLWGIWSPSNIRLGMNYSILNNLTVGIGTTKFNKMQDVQIKYSIIRQTRSNKIPVTVAVYEVMGIDGSADSKFGVNYKFSNRLNYYTQLIVARRFNDMFSLQLGGAFTHYNSMDSTMDHDRISVSFAGRIKFSPQSSFIVSGDFPLQIQSISEHLQSFNDNADKMKPNICMGLEVSTSTHAFQIYLGSSQGILPQEGIMYNKNDFFKGNILLGLNITRLWSF